MFKYVVSRMVCLDQFRLQMNCSLYVCEDSQESCESFDFVFNCVYCSPSLWPGLVSFLRFKSNEMIL